MNNLLFRCNEHLIFNNVIIIDNVNIYYHLFIADVIRI
jgi:hypothetical protein